MSSSPAWQVRFMQQSGKKAQSVWGDHSKMVELFGEPEEHLIDIIKEITYDMVMESVGL